MQAGGKLYLAGGGTRHQVYDPETETWKDVAPLPERLDHIQGVAVGSRIYYVGGLRDWPAPHVSSVYVYDTASDRFSRGAPMPRGRGAGGVVAHEREDLLRGRPERRRGGSVARRLRPGSRLVGAAAGHASSTRPLPGGRRGRHALRDRRPAGASRHRARRDRRVRPRGRRLAERARPHSHGSWRIRRGGARRTDLRHRRRDAGRHAVDGRGVRPADGRVADGRSDADGPPRHPGGRPQRHRPSSRGAARRRAPTIRSPPSRPMLRRSRRKAPTRHLLSKAR